MEKDLKEILGKKIRSLRRIHDVTQMDLARALGMKSTGAISQVENGSKGLAFENVGKTADFFGIHTCELLSSNDTPEEDLRLLVGVMKIISQRTKSKHYNTIRSLIEND